MTSFSIKSQKTFGSKGSGSKELEFTKFSIYIELMTIMVNNI